MIEINNINKEKVNTTLLKSLGTFVLSKYDLSSSLVSVAFVSGERMKSLNYSYRDLNKETDVLSFCSSKEEKNKENFLGEVVLNCNQIKKQAKELNNSFEHELAFIYIHGLLHLLGYNDKREVDRVKMIELGNRILLEFERL